MKQYEHQKYPSWRYHESDEPKIVHSDEEHEELGDEWLDAPVPKDLKAGPSAYENEEPQVKKGRKSKKQE